MGNIKSNKKIEKLIDTDFKSIKKYFDDVYGEITVLEDRKTKLQYALVQKIIDDPHQYENILQSKLEINNQNFIRLYKYYYHDIDICSMSKKYFLILEYEQNTLENQVSIRGETQKYFKKSQLISIFSQYIRLIKHFKNKFNFYPTISNHQIIFTKRFVLKIIDPHLFRSNHTLSIPFSHSDQINHQFLSPEKIRFLQKSKRNSQIFFDTEQSKIFVAGINFIQLATLISHSEINDQDAKRINYQKIQQAIRSARQIYGQQIETILKRMVAIIPQQRIQLDQLKLQLQRINDRMRDNQKQKIKKQPINYISKSNDRNRQN